MNPYLQIGLGIAATLLVSLVMFIVGRRFLTQDRQRDTQRGSEKEVKDDDRAAREKLAGQLEANVKEAARIEADRQAETARALAADQKEAAINLDAEQQRLVTRVGVLEREVIVDKGEQSSRLAVLTERVNNIAEWLRAKLGRKRINGD